MNEVMSVVNGFSNGWASAIWRASWQGGVAILVVYAICKALPKLSPPVRVWLWRLAFLKLLLSAVWSTPVQLPVLPPGTSTAALALQASGPGFSPARVSPIGPGSVPAAADVVLPSAVSVLLGAWVLGVIWYGLRTLLSWRAARRLRAGSKPVAEAEVLGALEELTRLSGVRRAPSVVAGTTAGPLLVGIRRPVIVLPEGLLRGCDLGEARLMLAHEVAHVKRRDLIWNWIPLLVQGLFFFHPLVWLGRREWDASQEMACDALALELTRSSGAEYGGMLVKVAGQRGTAREDVVAVGIVESYHTLKGRLAAIARIAPLSRRRLMVIGLALAALAVAGLTPWRLIARNAPSGGAAEAAVEEKGDVMATYPTSAMLGDLPVGNEDSNSYAAGLDMVLNYVGTPADYDTVMGDTGMAFIIMSEEGGPLIDGAVDVGWWPMASWGLEMRLGFLAQSVGREIRLIPADAAAFRADPAACYRERFEEEVKASIAVRKPVLIVHDVCWVVYGYDEGEPPLIGDWSLHEEQKPKRVERYPWALIVLGEERDRMDRKAADLAALRHAVALSRDGFEVRLPDYAVEWEPITARYTGQKSFALWAEMLRDTEHLGQRRWHSNMCLHLGLNRGSAVRYLREMAKRHPASVAIHLNAAADRYAQVLELLETEDTSEGAMMSKEGREKLARLAESMAAVEARAADEMEKAIAAAG